MSSRRSIVAVLFGGRSVEHDVSIVTGQQIMAAFPPDRYEIAPVYITRDGRWFTGAPLLQLENFRDDALLEMPGIEACLLSARYATSRLDHQSAGRPIQSQPRPAH